MNHSSPHTPFVFFGSSSLSVFVLDELHKHEYIPTLIVTTPDKPVGRHQILTPNIVKTWATEHNIPVLDPIKLDASFIEQLKNKSSELISERSWPIFIVASYGKIIPQSIIDTPSHHTLNIHPSLLPQYRGASPLPTAMLEDTKQTGVTIMQLDAAMDHGPIVAQRTINIDDYFPDWPPYEVFEEMMARAGARLLAETLPDWLAGKITVREQDHSRATYTKKITKEDGCIELTQDALLDLHKIPHDEAYRIFRKIQAFHEWPQVYFFLNHQGKQIRIKITDATMHDDTLQINKVIPEGKKEMDFYSFVQGYIK